MEVKRKSSRRTKRISTDDKSSGLPVYNLADFLQDGVQSSASSDKYISVDLCNEMLQVFYRCSQLTSLTENVYLLQSLTAL